MTTPPPPSSSSTTLDLPAPGAQKPVVFFRRTAKGKSNLRKRAATPPPASSSSGSDSEDDSTPNPFKKRKRTTTAVIAASSTTPPTASTTSSVVAPRYTATSRSLLPSNDATKQSNWYDEGTESSLLGRKAAPPKPGHDETVADDGTYHGKSTYSSFIKKSEAASTRKPVGPIKAPTNIRTITITDYAPDVCKDYKLTGFCGFGDTCKFLHAREDYAAGWKLDREWEIQQKGGKLPDLPGKKMGTGAWKPTDEKEEEEEVPFKCVICKDDYKHPIQTKCGHYFCERCAIERYKRKNPSCAICGKRTDGVFNSARGLQRKLDQARKREEERKKEEEAAAATAAEGR